MALEKKLIVGRYITHPTIVYTLKSNAVQPIQQNLFFCQEPTIASIKESNALSWKHPSIRTSDCVVKRRPETNKQHRNFHWLYWREKKITYLARTVDVLSGPFTGCWLIAFHYSGVDYVAHIGTTQTDAENQAVKQSWNTFAASLTGANYIIGGFNPHRECEVAVNNTWSQTRSSVQCWGLITTNNKYYSIVAIVSAAADRRAEIIAVIPVTSSPLGTLRCLH